jgi:hypothetical protein
MCLETKRVVSSYLHPAALYAYCRAADNTSPMRVGDGVVMITDRQMQDYLLCEECEDVLSKGGETWTNPKLATINKTFPLYDILRKRSAAYEDESGGLYFASDNPEIQVEKLTHFALGIFWKASVHPWKANQRDPMIQLGPYSNGLRLWLRGDSTFPKDVSLSVTVARPDRALVILSGPTQTDSKNRWRSFSLYLPGLAFTLRAGKLIDLETRMTCFHENPSHPILVSDDVMGVMYKRIAEHYGESRKTKGFLAASAKRVS